MISWLEDKHLVAVDDVVVDDVVVDDGEVVSVFGVVVTVPKNSL